MSGRNHLIRKSESIGRESTDDLSFVGRVFTSQLGKKSSLTPIKKLLQDICHVQTEFCQGNTMRWGIAWTFDESFQFAEQCQSHAASQKAKRKESNRAPICISFEAQHSFQFIKDYLENDLIRELNVSTDWPSCMEWRMRAGKYCFALRSGMRQHGILIHSSRDMQERSNHFLRFVLTGKIFSSFNRPSSVPMHGYGMPTKIYGLINVDDVDKSMHSHH